MKSCGIVMEYNPFHLGHLYQLKQAKKESKADIIVGVISSNFVQRGEPSILSKEDRVRLALNNGVDLVIELPFIYSVEAAEIYAKYATLILDALRCDYMCFGSETGSIVDLKKKYGNGYVCSPRLDEEIQLLLDKGIGYPKAYATAQKNIHNYYLEEPNDILAMAYLKTIKDYKLKIKPISIKRNNKYKSASYIRKLMLDKVDVSKYINYSTTKYKLNSLDKYYELLKYRLLTTSPSELAKIHMVDEGIENLFIKKIKETSNMEEFISSCVSKRYSAARIKRTLIHILVNTSKKEAKSLLKDKINYIRILGFNQKGQEYLKTIKKDIKVKIIAKFAGKDDKMAQLEKKASDVYYINSNKNKNFEKEIALFPIKMVDN